MKTTGVLLSLMFFLCFSAAAQDAGYYKAFGSNSIAASVKGFPAKDKYDASQFDYKNKIFYVDAGDKSTIDLRVLLSQGMTIGSYLDKLKKNATGNIKYRQSDFCSVRIWASQDRSGKELVTAKMPWPVKLTDEPLWSEPMEVFVDIDQKHFAWPTMAFGWDDQLREYLQSTLANAMPGMKFYIAFYVGFKYKTPGGQTEYKWNSIFEKWMPEIAQGLLGYERLKPIAVCTVEVKEDASSERFKDNGNGTKTDTQTGLMWLKSPRQGALTWTDAMSYADKLEFAGFTDWRLPTADELKVFSEVQDKNGTTAPYPWKWYNSHGFQKVEEANYWTSTPESYDDNMVKMYDLKFGGERTTVKSAKDACAWAVRKP